MSAGTFTARADAGTRLLVGRRSEEAVKGTFVRTEAGALVLRLSDRQELSIPFADVRFVEYAGRAPTGSIWTSLPEGGPARDRTMLAPDRAPSRARRDRALLHGARAADALRRDPPVARGDSPGP